MFGNRSNYKKIYKKIINLFIKKLNCKKLFKIYKINKKKNNDKYIIKKIIQNKKKMLILIDSEFFN